MKIPFRPLGKVRELVETIGMEVAYAYDDLIFSNNSMFILRFDDEKPETLHLYFNKECEVAKAKTVEGHLTTTGKVAGFKIVNAGHFGISQIEGKEELEVIFFE